MTKVFVIGMAFLCMGLPEVLAAGNLKDNGNGTVTDSKTLLMWQQGEGDEMEWKDAIASCKKLSLAGYNDWRLPNKEELESIRSVGRVPAINKPHFPDAKASAYWSSTSYVDVPSGVWVVNFSDGYSNGTGKTDSVYVRCVRGGK